MATHSADVLALVLRLLSPSDLERAACVNRAWHSAARRLALRDVARGQEAALLLLPSAVDAAKLAAAGASSLVVAAAAGFTYHAFLEEEPLLSPPPSPSLSSPPLATSLCSCSADSPHVRGGLECGPACACASCPASCPLRETQARVAAPLSLRSVAGAGWGVFADAPIRHGAFVCTYAGTPLSVDEARRRLAAQDEHRCDNYVMVLRETLPDGTVLLHAVDPRRRGNIGRFINHACDGGCLELRLVRSAGAKHPRAAFFASRPIETGTELRYAYGTPSAKGSRRCNCGTAACQGTLPFDANALA